MVVLDQSMQWVSRQLHVTGDQPVERIVIAEKSPAQMMVAADASTDTPAVSCEPAVFAGCRTGFVAARRIGERLELVSDAERVDVPVPVLPGHTATVVLTGNRGVALQASPGLLAVACEIFTGGDVVVVFCGLAG